MPTILRLSFPLLDEGGFPAVAPATSRMREGAEGLCREGFSFSKASSGLKEGRSGLTQMSADLGMLPVRARGRAEPPRPAAPHPLQTQAPLCPERGSGEEHF